jgi:hypothetical protein
MEKIIKILKTDNNLPELRDIEIGSTINVSLTEDKFNDLYNEIKWVNGELQEKSDFYKITYAGITFNITKK